MNCAYISHPGTEKLSDAFWGVCVFVPNYLMTKSPLNINRSNILLKMSKTHPKMSSFRILYYFYFWLPLNFCTPFTFYSLFKTFCSVVPSFSSNISFV